MFDVNFLSNYVLYVKNKSLAHDSFTGRKFEFLVFLTANFKVTEHFLQFLKLPIFLVEKVNCPCKTYLQLSTFSISGKVNIEIPSFPVSWQRCGFHREFSQKFTTATIKVNMKTLLRLRAQTYSRLCFVDFLIITLFLDNCAGDTGLHRFDTGAVAVTNVSSCV